MSIAMMRDYEWDNFLLYAAKCGIKDPIRRTETRMDQTISLKHFFDNRFACTRCGDVYDDVLSKHYYCYFENKYGCEMAWMGVCADCIFKMKHVVPKGYEAGDCNVRRLYFVDNYWPVCHMNKENYVQWLWVHRVAFRSVVWDSYGVYSDIDVLIYGDDSVNAVGFLSNFYFMFYRRVVSKIYLRELSVMYMQKEETTIEEEKLENGLDPALEHRPILKYAIRWSLKEFYLQGLKKVSWQILGWYWYEHLIKKMEVTRHGLMIVVDKNCVWFENRFNTEVIVRGIGLNYERRETCRSLSPPIINRVALISDFRRESSYEPPMKRRKLNP